MDIRTLALVLGIMHAAQVGVFALQFATNRTYRGIGWWLAWSATAAAGFACVPLRLVPALSTPAVFAQNLFLVSAVVFLYVGLVRFFDRRENPWLVWPGLLLYGAVHGTFLLVLDDITVRTVAVCLALAVVAFVSARAVLVGTPPPVAAAARLCGGAFLVHGFVFLQRGLAALAGADVSDLFRPSVFNLIPFVDGFLASFIWTCGVIIMVNQRATADVQAAKDEVRLLNAELEGRVLERTSELEAAVRELEAFTYTTSHDLRAPLRAINGYARILEDDHAARLDFEGRRVLGVVMSEAARMGRLVDSLLEFARLGRRKLRKSQVDMTALAGEVRAELLVPADGRVVELRIPRLPPAQADRPLLRQVWLSLLGNAVKYTANRELAVIEVTGALRQDEVEYAVRDNGVGFDMRHADKLFRVFQRLHLTDQFEGAGVGLAVAQRIVHRHGGRIWAEAEPDRGATFHFTLPLDTQRSVTDGGAPGTAPASGVRS